MYIMETFLEYPDNYSNAALCFFTGCDNDCIGCANPDLKIWQPENYENCLNDIKLYMSRIKTNKAVFVGGDCLYIKNIELTQYLLSQLSPDTDICIYTGSPITQVPADILEKCTYIKCEKYDETQKQEAIKTDTFIQFSSKNQKLYTNTGLLLSVDGKFYFKI